MATVGEFTYALGFEKPDLKNLEKAEKKAKETADKSAKAFEESNKRVEKAEDLVAKARSKEAKARAREMLRVAKRQQKHAKMEVSQAQAAAREVGRAYQDAYRKAEQASEKSTNEQKRNAEELRKELVGMSRLGGVSGALGRAAGGGLGLGGLFLGGLAIGGAAAAGRKAFTFAEEFSAQADEIAKTSKKLDVPAEQLQRLRFAAERSGVSAETVTQSLKDMNKLLAEGRANKEAPIAKVAKALRLDLDALAQMQPEARIGAIADALTQVTDDNLRARAQLAFFGEEAGVQLTPLLAEGSRGIRALGDELQELGGIIDDEGLSRAEAYQDQLTNMKRQLSGVAAEIGVQLLPAFGDLIDDTSEWVTENEEFLQQDMPQAIRETAVAMGELAKAAADAIGFVSKLNREWEDFVKPDVDTEIAVRKSFFGNQGAFARSLQDLTGLDLGAYDDPGELSRNNPLREGGGGEALNRRALQASGRVDRLAQRAAGRQGRELNAAAARAAARANRAVRGALGTSSGGDSPEERERKRLAKQLGEGALGDELRAAQARFGGTQQAIDSALLAAAAAQQEGSAESVIRRAALGRFGGLVGQDLMPKRESDPFLSQIFNDDNLPDAQLSMLARGTDPQVLVSTINNNFDLSVEQRIDGEGSPGATGDAAIASVKQWMQDQVNQATKTTKVNFAR